MASLGLVPPPGKTIEETLGALAINFDLEQSVVQAFLKHKIANLEEFRFFFDSEAQVKTFLGKLNLGDDRMIQVARLRRAWSAVSLYFKQCDTDRSKVSATDLDSLLGDSELRDVKVAFWTRYRVRLPPELYPSDATVSRVSREMSKRLLCIFDVWKVRSLQFQLTSSSTKRKLADTLFVGEDADEDTVARDWEGYLDRLYTLLVAYALAGTGRVSGAPEAAREAVLGADSTSFVQVPLDVLLAYYYRARRVLQSLPHHKRLGWLQAQDLAERTEWVTKFRESTKTLGKVVMEVFEARDPHWVVCWRGERRAVATNTPSTSLVSQSAVGRWLKC